MAQCASAIRLTSTLPSSIEGKVLEFAGRMPALRPFLIGPK